MPVSKSRNKTAVEKDTQPVRRYATEKLLKSSHLKEYQPDFARVILTEPEYSVEEARCWERGETGKIPVKHEAGILMPPAIPGKNLYSVPGPERSAMRGW